MIAGNAAPESPSRPAKCPQCSGRDVTTASKVIDASTYWRCLSCGEIWRLDRHNGAGRFGFRR